MSVRDGNHGGDERGDHPRDVQLVSDEEGAEAMTGGITTPTPMNGERAGGMKGGGETAEDASLNASVETRIWPPVDTVSQRPGPGATEAPADDDDDDDDDERDSQQTLRDSPLEPEVPALPTMPHLGDGVEGGGATTARESPEVIPYLPALPYPNQSRAVRVNPQVLSSPNARKEAMERVSRLHDSLSTPNARGSSVARNVAAAGSDVRGPEERGRQLDRAPEREADVGDVPMAPATPLGVPKHHLNVHHGAILETPPKTLMHPRARHGLSSDEEQAKKPKVSHDFPNAGTLAPQSGGPVNAPMFGVGPGAARTPPVRFSIADAGEEDELVNACSRSGQALGGGGVGAVGGGEVMGAPTASQTPSWVQSLMDSMQSLHVKQNQFGERQSKMNRSLDVIETEVRGQELRIETLECAVREHTTLHELTQSTFNKHAAFQDDTSRRVKELETRLDSMQREASRSPTPPPRDRSPGSRGFSFGSGRYGRNGDRSPRSDRVMEVEEELQVVVGGWEDARSDEAEAEVELLFQQAGLQDAMGDFEGPQGRTRVVRVNLKFPTHLKSIPDMRNFQGSVLTRLKAVGFRSKLPGSEDRALWATRNRTPEDRAKIRGLVQVKEFICWLDAWEGRAAPKGEIYWRTGTVFVDGRINVVLEARNLGQPNEHDVFLQDNRGDHTGWVLSAHLFHRATGRPSESLPGLWDRWLQANPGPGQK